MTSRAPGSTLFPYTTLFRSEAVVALPKIAAESIPPLIGWAQRHGFELPLDRKSTRLNSSHVAISYAVFCLKKKTVHGTAPSNPGRRPDRWDIGRSRA